MLSRLWIVAAVLVCSACSQRQPQSSPALPENMQYISQSAAADLAVASEGQQLQLADSPWGPDVSLQIRKRYFAATGRVCLEALANQQPVLICDYQQAGWAAQRLLSGQEE